MKFIITNPFLHKDFRSALAGFVSGVVILGIGGRLLMWAVAFVLHGSGGFTFGGSIEVLIAGAVFGIIGGLILLLVPAYLTNWSTVIHAVLMFVFFAFISGASRRALSGIAWPERFPVLIAFGGLLLCYSLLLIYLFKKTAFFDAQSTV
jgi:hypothetical protein